MSKLTTLGDVLNFAIDNTNDLAIRSDLFRMIDALHLQSADTIDPLTDIINFYDANFVFTVAKSMPELTENDVNTLTPLKVKVLLRQSDQHVGNAGVCMFDAVHYALLKMFKGEIFADNSL